MQGQNEGLLLYQKGKKVTLDDNNILESIDEARDAAREILDAMRETVESEVAKRYKEWKKISGPPSVANLKSIVHTVTNAWSPWPN